jgi:hypothetical protein
MNPQLLQFLIPMAIIVPVVLLRARRLGRKQPLKLGMLWLRPAILVIACAVALALPQPGMAPRHFLPIDWGLLVLAGMAGAAGGWQLGRTMAIEVHPENGTLMVQSSPLGLLVLVALVLLRMGLRTGVRLEADAWHLDATLIIDMLIVFTAALFVTRSLEMYLRARRVMRSAPPIA